MAVIVYVDMDSGTILVGPIYRVEISAEEIDAVLSSDSAAREYALDHGERLK
jgi:hypothetical protein